MRKILFHGNDSYLSLNSSKEFAKELGLEIEVIDIQQKSIDEVLNLFLSGDIFSESKTYILKRISENKSRESIIKFLIDNFSKLNSSTNYIFWEPSKIASNTKYYKLFGKEIFEYNQLNKPSFYKYCADVISKYNIQSDRETLILLSQRVNFSTERLNSELEKYSLGNYNILTKDIIESVTPNTLESQIWDLTDAINSSQKEKIYEILNKLNYQEVDANFILSMISRNLRLITQVKHLSFLGKDSKEICSTLRIPPFTLPSLLSTAKRITWEKVKYLYEKIASLDFEIKTGNIEALTGLTLLLNRI